MFFDTREYPPDSLGSIFRSCVVPRPIGWISTIKDGVVNLAPYSYFNAICDIPPMVMYSSECIKGHKKDTFYNIRSTEEFVVNIVSYDLREKMILSSKNLPREVSEAEEFDIKMAQSTLVNVPRVEDAPISLECSYVKTISLDFKDSVASHCMVIGCVKGIYIKDQILSEGKVDVHKFLPIARLGSNEYSVAKDIFKMDRPM